MSSHLPTLVSASWTVTALRDSLIGHLTTDKVGRDIRMFFYAVTESGWRAVRSEFRKWLSHTEKRHIVAYVGTDHAITEAEAIRLMVEDGVTVRLMTTYRGVFHPKVVWLRALECSFVWIGSNNLTRDGLLNNIEFAAVLKSQTIPIDLERWAQEVHNGSVAFSEELLDEYDKERCKYGERRVSLGTFTWSRREKGEAPAAKRNTSKAQGRKRHSTTRRGDLIVEVMPRETGAGGKQIQLPMRAATHFFGLQDHVGASRVIRLTPSWLNDPRDLTMTIFGNHTVRLVIKELDYRDRPCVLLFRRTVSGSVAFDIVSRSVFPSRYRELLQRCDSPTRQGSRSWGIV